MFLENLRPEAGLLNCGLLIFVSVDTGAKGDGGYRSWVEEGGGGGRTKGWPEGEQGAKVPLQNMSVLEHNIVMERKEGGNKFRGARLRKRVHVSRARSGRRWRGRRKKSRR